MKHQLLLEKKHPNIFILAVCSVVLALVLLSGTSLSAFADTEGLEPSESSAVVIADDDDDTIPIDDATVTVASGDYVYTTKSITPDVTVVLDGVKLVAGIDYTVSYENNINAGRATVIVEGINFYAGTATATFEIQPADISSDGINFTFSGYSEEKYTGEPIEPTVTGRDYRNASSGVTLYQDTDFLVMYENNIEVGEATVLVIGIGNYTGVVSHTFTIFPYFSLYTESKNQEQLIRTYTLDDLEALAQEGRDPFSAMYWDFYEGNWAGGWKVISSDYYMTLEELFSDAGISEFWGPGYSLGYGGDDLDSKGTPQWYTYEVLAQQNRFYPAASGMDCFEPENYKEEPIVFTIREYVNQTGDGTGYPTAQDCQTDTLTWLHNNPSEGWKNTPRILYGISEEMYRYQTEGDRTATGYRYWSRCSYLELKLTEQDITSNMFDVDTHTVTYTGEAFEPTVTSDLELGVDYTVSYSNNVDAGTGRITITGIGDYSGTLYENFTILPAEISGGDISDIESAYLYTGSQITPQPTVKVGTNTLVEGSDYTLSYGDNVDVGVGTLTVTGQGNYTGEITVEFAIVEGSPIEGAEVAFKNPEESFVYDGTAHTPEVIVTVDGDVLEQDTDYDLVYSDNVNAGVATIVIVGKGMYSGYVSTTFTIAAADISGAEITGIDATYAYTGDAIEPVPVVVVGDKTLVADVDYVVSYENNTKIGTATITIGGIGNYTNTATKTFEIVEAAHEVIVDQPAHAGISVDKTDALAGEEVTVTVTVEEGYEITDVVVKDEGGTKLEVTAVGNNTYTFTMPDSDVTVEVQVSEVAPEKITITTDMFEVDTTYGIYDGSTPVTKTVSSDLTEGVDYTVTYTNNTSAGEATITITGIGDYEGTLTYTFKVIHYFEDVGATVNDGNSWYFDAVYGMVDLGAITGYNETIFGVGDSMSRAQLVTIMWRYCEPDQYAAYDEPNAKDTTGLPDAQDGTYYTGAVNWAYANGVITGNQQSDGTYTLNPDDPVIFDQMVTIVARYCLGGTQAAADYPQTALNDGAFTDKDTVEEYARGSMAWAIANSIVTGNDNHDGTFTLSPLENVARERATTVIYRTIEDGLLIAE